MAIFAPNQSTLRAMEQSPLRVLQFGRNPPDWQIQAWYLQYERDNPVELTGWYGNLPSLAPTNYAMPSSSTRSSYASSCRAMTYSNIESGYSIYGGFPAWSWDQTVYYPGTVINGRAWDLDTHPGGTGFPHGMLTGDVGNVLGMGLGRQYYFGADSFSNSGSHNNVTPASLWVFRPGYVDGDHIGYLNSVWQNQIMCQRCKYRINVDSDYWLAYGELWSVSPTYELMTWEGPGAFTGTTAAYGWDVETYWGPLYGQPEGYYALNSPGVLGAGFFKLRNVSKYQDTTSLTGCGLSVGDMSDTTTGWKEIPLPDTDPSDFYSDSALTPGPSWNGSDGFVGKIMFAVINETPAAWEARTGITLV